MQGREDRRAGQRSGSRGWKTARRLRGETRGLPPATPEWLDGARLFMPQGYEPGHRYPLLVWLPDSDRFDLGRAMARTSLRNYVAVQPATTADDGVWQAVDAASRRASVHPDRVYLVGHAAAGTAAFRLACRHPRSFAGVVSIAGRFPLGEGLFAGVESLRRMPMLLCCAADGSRDDAAHTDATLRLFHAAGAMLALRIYPRTSGLSRLVLADVNRWIMEDVCGPAARPQPATAGRRAPPGLDS